MPKTTWIERYDAATAPEVKICPNGFGDIQPGQQMLITTPRQLATFIEAIPKGTSKPMKTLRDELAAAHGAEKSCPVMTGIHLRTVAEIVTAKLAEGISPDTLTPVWRVIEPKAPITKKLEHGAGRLMDLRAGEGLSAS